MVKLESSKKLTRRRKYFIETTILEGAVAVSGENIIVNKNLTLIQQIVKDEFKAMNFWVLDKGGIIGHLKGFLSTDNQSVMVSSTGDEVYCHIQNSGDQIKDSVTVSLVSIAFNISHYELEEQLILIFEKINA